MDTKMLLPNRYKRIGWILFIPCFLLTVFGLFFSDTDWFSSLNFFQGEHLFSNWTHLKIAEQKNWLPDFANEDFAGEILMTLTALGFLFVAFSREKLEDEWIMKTRLESLLLGFYGHIAFFFISIWLGYSLGFYIFLSWNMLVAPIVFLCRFHWLVYVKPYLEERRTNA